MTEQPPSFDDVEPAAPEVEDPEAVRDEGKSGVLLRTKLMAAAAPLLSSSGRAPASQSTSDQITIRDLLSNPTLRGPAILITTVMCLQQASGVNAVLYYSTPILQNVLKTNEAGYITLGITIVNAVMTLPAIVLIDVSFSCMPSDNSVSAAGHYS